jgi:hypothetical protein
MFVSECYGIYRVFSFLLPQQQPFLNPNPSLLSSSEHEQAHRCLFAPRPSPPSCLLTARLPTSAHNDATLSSLFLLFLLLLHLLRLQMLPCSNTLQHTLSLRVAELIWQVFSTTIFTVVPTSPAAPLASCLLRFALLDCPINNEEEDQENSSSVN